MLPRHLHYPNKNYNKGYAHRGIVQPDLVKLNMLQVRHKRRARSPSFFDFCICPLSAAAVLKGSHDRCQIMLKHGDITCCRTTALRKGVGKQATADLQPGFL